MDILRPVNPDKLVPIKASFYDAAQMGDSMLKLPAWLGCTCSSEALLASVAR
jgi:hypothetical protein